MANENIDEQILTLYSEEKWEDIVRLKCILNKTDKSKLFWVLPTFNDLRWIQELIEKYNLIGLVSIGCGCGLLEWLLKKYSGLDVIGVELDRSWWCSKYSPPLFLKNIVFISESDANSMFLLDKHAFLFCYFNNASAFCYYIENYKGNFIFVIGPQENEHRLSDPMPLDAKFDEYNWTLIHKKELERTGDYITVYRR